MDPMGIGSVFDQRMWLDTHHGSRSGSPNFRSPWRQWWPRCMACNARAITSRWGSSRDLGAFLFDLCLLVQYQLPIKDHVKICLTNTVFIGSLIANFHS